jgi:hypothetical protein
LGNVFGVVEPKYEYTDLKHSPLAVIAFLGAFAESVYDPISYPNSLFSNAMFSAKIVYQEDQ